MIFHEYFYSTNDNWNGAYIYRWDTRKLNEPLDKLLIDPIKTDDQLVSRSYGVTVLEYETTMPTKFMCGTDVGMVFVCNRKGKSPMEKINFRVCSISNGLLWLGMYIILGTKFS